MQETSHFGSDRSVIKCNRSNTTATGPERPWHSISERDDGGRVTRQGVISFVRARYCNFTDRIDSATTGS